MIRDQKTLILIVLALFFFGLSKAWKASWQSAKMSALEVIESEAVNVAALKKGTIPFVVPKRKESAPAWGSFKVAGQGGTPISLKYDFNASLRPSPPPSAKPPLGDKKKKAAEAAKKKKSAVAKALTPTPASPYKSAAEEKKMSRLKDEPAQPGAIVVAQAPAAPVEDATQKPKKGRSAQEWESYLTEDSSRVYVRTTEFIQAFQKGELADEDSGPTPSWMYGLIQKMFDNNSMTIQQQGLRIGREIPSDQTFAILVRNAESVDKGLRAELTTTIQRYEDIKLVKHLKKSMFHYDQVVQIQSLDVLDRSVRANLAAQSQTAPAVNGQRSASSTTDPKDLFSGFIDFLERLATEDKDASVKGKALELSNNIRTLTTTTIASLQLPN